MAPAVIPTPRRSHPQCAGNAPQQIRPPRGSGGDGGRSAGWWASAARAGRRPGVSRRPRGLRPLARRPRIAARGSRFIVQGFEHAFQGNLAVRGIGELAHLVPVDRGGLEIAGQPAARTEVGRRVEPLVLEQRRTIVAVRFEDQAPGSFVGTGDDAEDLAAGTEGRSPPCLDLDRFGEGKEHLRTAAR
jgi:hypothetical protein